MYKTRSLEHVYDAVELPSFEEMRADKLAYARSFNVQYLNSVIFHGEAFGGGVSPSGVRGAKPALEAFVTL